MRRCLHGPLGAQSFLSYSLQRDIKQENTAGVTFSWRRLLFNPTNWVPRRDEPLRGRKRKRHSVSPEKVSLRPAARDGKGLSVHTREGEGGEGQARVKSPGKGSALTLPGRRNVPVTGSVSAREGRPLGCFTPDSSNSRWPRPLIGRLVFRA